MAMSPVMVELRASIGEFKAKMAEAREEVKKLADDGAKHHERFASFGKAALLGLAGVAVAVGTVSLEMADRFEASHAKLVAAMKGAGVSFEAYRPQIEATQKQMEKFGYTNADTQAALAQFTVSLKDPKKGLEQMGLAADLAKFKNIPLADSALVVAKAMEGQLRPLKALGIDLPVAAAGALRLEKAHAALAAAQDKVNALLEKYPGAVNVANKHHAMYEAALMKVATAQTKLKETMGEVAVVLKALHERLGGQAAAAAETFGGKVLAMKTQADDFAKNLGLMLIPILEKLMTATSKTIDWFKQHKDIAQALGIMVGTFLVAAIATYVGSLVVATGASVINFAKMIAAGVAWVASSAASFTATLYLQAMYARESIASAVTQGAAWLAVKSGQLATFVAQQVAGAATWVATWVAKGAVFLAEQAVTGATWLAAWVVRSAVLVANAAASGAVWIAQNAVRLAVYVTANTIAALESYAPWILQFNRMIVSSATAGATWLAQNTVRLATFVASNVAAGATWVATWVASGFGVATGSATTGAGWLAGNVARLATFVSSNIAAAATWVATWVASGAKVLADAIATGATWVATWVASGVRVLAAAAVTSARWLAETAVSLALFVARNVASAAVYLATWIATNAVVLASAIATGIGIVIAAGPILLILAAVGLAAYMLYKNWDQVWGFIKSITAAAWQWIQKHLLLVAMAFGPVGLAAYALYRNWTTIWDGIKSAVSSAWSYIKPIIDGITSAISSVTGAVGSLSSIGGSVSKTLSNPFSLGSFKMPDLSHMFANGTDYAPGGLSLVGERGPELLNLPRGSQVIPTSKLGSLSSVTVGNTNLTVNGNLDNVTLAQVRLVLDAHTRDLVSELRAGRR